MVSYAHKQLQGTGCQAFKINLLVKNSAGVAQLEESHQNIINADVV